MPKELVKVNSNVPEKINWKKMNEKTPQEYIRTRQGRGNQTVAYVETGYIVKTLNELFNYMWDFKVIEEKMYEKAGQLTVLGELTVWLSPEFHITKTQYGSAKIKMDKANGIPVSVGDDKKAAASDALKKCASLFGIASDIYWGGDIDTEDEVESSPQTNVDAVEGIDEQPSLLKLTRRYFAVAKDAGYENDRAKNIAKKICNVDSFTQIGEEKLKALIKRMEEEIEKKSQNKTE